jgi:hypothetical protein
MHAEAYCARGSSMVGWEEANARKERNHNITFMPDEAKYLLKRKA